MASSLVIQVKKLSLEVTSNFITNTSIVVLYFALMGYLEGN